MTRAEFRAEVASPRPPSAWLMALVASATLWITGELDAWVAPVQIVCFAVSYWTRHQPPRWRCSPIWLNVGMAAVTSVTISQALEGSPATLSLAYFASLAQGLQLIDARPRKSEFLLVALALFQVILAANLTDSVFFPPLLIVFLVSVTWTLMVHTLRTEAAEAGDARAASLAITPGLRRNTLIASTVSIALAGVLFMTLPRMRASMLRGGLGQSLAMAGFSDQVSLGTIGRIRQDGTVVLRIETLGGRAPARSEAYWRGLAFDRFDGRSWAITESALGQARAYVSGSPRFGVELRGGPGENPLIQRIVREPVEAGVVFSAGGIRRIQGPIQRLEADHNGGLYDPGQANERIRYTIWTDPFSPGDSDLWSDRAAPPRETGPLAEQRAQRYLALPAFDPAVGEMAREIVSGLSNDAERARAIELSLRSRGRYTDDPPDMGTGERSPIEDFLQGDLAGHCEYFASAMVVLARSLGMPARLVNGFAGGRTNRIGGFTEITRSDAHAWVEIHFQAAGWVRYDPTPPDLRLRQAGALSLMEQIAELGSVIELWWFQRVVDFDSSDQILALRSAWLLAKDLLPQAEAPSTRPARSSPSGWRIPAALRLRTVLIIGAAGVLGALLLRRRRGEPDPVPRSYRRALRLLARRHLLRGESTTARGFAQQVRANVPAGAAECFERITEAYLAQRFGGAERAASERAVAGDLSLLQTRLHGR